MKKYFVKTAEGDYQGPFTPGQIRNRIQEGEIDKEAKAIEAIGQSRTQLEGTSATGLLDITTIANMPDAKGAAANAEPTEVVRAIVTDFQMPFGSMVVFIMKWVLASIPAMILLFLIFSVISAIFGGLFLGLINEILRSI